MYSAKSLRCSSSSKMIVNIPLPLPNIGVPRLGGTIRATVFWFWTIRTSSSGFTPAISSPRVACASSSSTVFVVRASSPSIGLQLYSIAVLEYGDKSNSPSVRADLDSLSLLTPMCSKFTISTTGKQAGRMGDDRACPKQTESRCTDGLHSFEGSMLAAGIFCRWQR